MPDLTHIEPERQRARATLIAKSPDELVNVKAGELVSLIDDLQRAREGCRKALTCASIPDSVRQVIVEALASARAAKGAEQ